jgi:hypothetical protein
MLFAFVFAVETIIKIIAKGFASNQLPVKPYISEIANQLDLVVVTVQVLDAVSYFGNSNRALLKVIKSMRIFRVLSVL